MKKTLIFFMSILIGGLFLQCGIAPPTEDLNRVKAALAKAEEAKADQFAKEEYAASKTKLEESEKIITPKKSKKNKIAKKQLAEAKAQAEAAYKKAAPAYAQYNIDEAKKVEKTAEEIKANVALKDKFSEAVKLLDEAKQDKKAGNYELSWEKSIKAKTLFDEVYKITQEKKQAAEEAMKGAKEALQEASEKSKEGEGE